MNIFLVQITEVPIQAKNFLTLIDSDLSNKAKFLINDQNQ